ncbi:hypothetical protein WISP_146961 [Willisornis vidua]|uniref:Uncharacterized protein n=1 Tax=Willisornis vidua TaxID=1566151 RepID=A0ABQ9CQS0_9PASS|nr:hypothetical protein WISP_146961 [Willisornis vidua]
MVFNKGKSQVMPLRKVSPMHQNRLGSEQLEISFAEKDLGVLVDTKFSMRQQSILASKKAKSILTSVRKNLESSYDNNKQDYLKERLLITFLPGLINARPYGVAGSSQQIEALCNEHNQGWDGEKKEVKFKSKYYFLHVNPTGPNSASFILLELIFPQESSTLPSPVGTGNMGNGGCSKVMMLHLCQSFLPPDPVANSEEGHKADKKTRTPPLQTQAEKVGAVHLGEEKLHEEFITPSSM